jgi:vacuolar-type H+-ATPase subunit E/Vma4
MTETQVALLVTTALLVLWGVMVLQVFIARRLVELSRGLRQLQQGMNALQQSAVASAAREASMTEQNAKMNASLDRLNTISNAIATALKDALASLNGSATKEEEDAAIARIDSIATFLETAVGTNEAEQLPDVPTA